MRQKNHPNSIRQKLQTLKICPKNPKKFKKDGCEVNLTGFQKIQSSFVVDIDQEIKKNPNLCKGKRCDLLLFIESRCVLIEAKSGPVLTEALRQLKSTATWLQSKGVVTDSTKRHFLLVGQIKPYQQRSREFKKHKPLRIKCGQCIHTYLKKRQPFSDLLHKTSP